MNLAITLLVTLASAAPFESDSPFQDDVRSQTSALKKELDEHEGQPALLAKTYAKIATLNRSLPKPQAQLTKLLGEGLGEQDYTVREAVLRELVRGQEPAETVKAVLAGLKEIDKDWKAIDKSLVAMNADRGKMKAGGVQMKEVTRLTAGASFFPWYFEALGHVPDAKVQKDLVSRMKKGLGTFPGRMRVGLANGCLANGSDDAVGAVAAYLDELGGALAKDKVSERYPRGKDKSMRMMDVWLAAYGEARAPQLETIAAAVEAFALAKGLAAPPNPMQRNGKVWVAWWKANREPLGAGAGRMETVLTVELPEIPAGDGKKTPFDVLSGDD